MSTATQSSTKDLGYKTHAIGGFRFERDEYFAHIFYPGGRHLIPVEEFLRALMRDVAWGFFYGTVNFDAVLGTVNHYGTVELYAGLFNAAYRQAGRSGRSAGTTCRRSSARAWSLSAWWACRATHRVVPIARGSP